MDVLLAALSCSQCRARNDRYLPPAVPGDGQRSSLGGSDPLTPYELLDQEPTRNRFASIRRGSPESSSSLSVSLPSPPSRAIRPSSPSSAPEPDPSLRSGTVCVTWLLPKALLLSSSTWSIAPGCTPTRSTQRSRCAMGSTPGITRWGRSAGAVRHAIRGVRGKLPARTTLDASLVTPTKEAWYLDHDRGVLCTVGSPGHPTKGSVRHSGR